jgi:alpha-1,3-rhamnosyl/mannosyltransferase
MFNLPARPKLTATLFDMSCWIVPHTHEQANIEATKSYTQRIIDRADGIIAISQSAKTDAIRILGVNEERINVIYPGVCSSFFDVSAGDVNRIRKLYDLDRPYILSLGTIEPRKNLDLLLDAYCALPPAVQKEWPLIFAGPKGWHCEKTLSRFEDGNGRWRYLGYVPEQHLPALTAGAALFAFPSMYEGFGFPLVQAMAAGIPCITSNISSLPEVAGEGAILVDPRSQSEMRDAMLRLLMSPSERIEIGNRGRAQARRYDWEVAAQQTWAFFERVLSPSS